MASDKEVGEFLLRELWPEKRRGSVFMFHDWLWSGRIIAAMRHRGWNFEACDIEPFVAFNNMTTNPDGRVVAEKATPRTIALAAAKALGMDVG